MEITDAVIVALITGLFSVLTLYMKLKFEKKQKDNDEPHIELAYHPFFVRSEMLKTHIETTFTLENKGKEAVFKDILYNQITAFQEVLLDLAKRVDRGEVNDTNHLYNLHMEALEDIINKHRNFYRNSNYTHEEQAALDIVMKKYNIWNQGKMNRLQENILTICNSPFYNAEFVKAAAIFDLYLGVSIDTINDASKTLNSINGDLRGLKFKNIII